MVYCIDLRSPEVVLVYGIQRREATSSSRWLSCIDDTAIETRFQSYSVCPTDFAKWRDCTTGVGVQDLLYLSTFRQLVNKDHRQCNSTSCVADNYDPSRTNTSHRCASGNCGLLEADATALAKLCEEGSVALLDIECGSSLQETMVHTLKATPQTHYVVVSHIWAEGLGNPAKNALPRCQLRYLAQAAGRLHDTMERGYPARTKLLLWLDTMCCPIGNEQARHNCLGLMRQIYDQAEDILILDAEFLERRSSDLDAVELYARIAFCAWSKRLWTLPEIMSGKHTWILLADAPVAMTRNTLAFSLDSVGPTQHILYKLLWQLLSWSSTTSGKGMNQNVVDLKDLVEYRTVTDPYDEPLCLSICLNLCNEIATVSPKGRMRALWMALGARGMTIPKTIIFFKGPRLTSIGARWAPASLLGPCKFHKLQAPVDSTQKALLTQDGLMATFPAFECQFSRRLSERERTFADAAYFALGSGLIPGMYLKRNQDWLIMDLKNHADELKKNKKATVLLDVSLDALRSTQPNGTIAPGVVGLVEKEGTVRHLFRTSTSVEVSFLDDAQASLLTAVLDYCQRHDLSKETFTSVTSNGLYKEELQNATNSVLAQLRGRAHEALQQDPTLFGMVKAQLKDPDPQQDVQESMEHLTKLMLHYIAGRFAEITRTWPETQGWCLN